MKSLSHTVSDKQSTYTSLLYLIILFSSLAVHISCKSDRCEDLPAQAQIDVELEGTLAGDAESCLMMIIINGEKEVSHTFPKAAPSFTFEFKEYDRPPRTLEARVTVYDKDDQVLGVGQLNTTFSSDGCNFLTVIVQPKGAPDSGPDGISDGRTDIGADAADASVDATSDLAPDALHDTAMDLTADATMDAGPMPDIPIDAGPSPDTTSELGVDMTTDAGVDAPMDIGTDSGIIGPVVNLMEPYGIPISTALETQAEPAVASDGTNFFVVWEDHRNGTGSDIYGARISPDGTLLDPVGIAISTAADDQAGPAVAFNGTEYLVVWGDRRDGVTLDIYGTRVDTGGTVKDAVGFPIFVGTKDQYVPAVACDGTSCLVVWHDVDGENIIGARVDAAGAVLDTAGIAVCTAGNGQYIPSLAFDGTNYLVVWFDYRASWDDANIYGARVTPGGTVLDPAGIPICTAVDDQHEPAVAFDGSQYLVVWGDKRDGGYFSLYGARVDPDGTVLDPAGIPICTDPGMQYSSAVAYDGINFLVAFFESSSSGENIFGVRVSPTGTVLDSTKFDISTAGGSQDHPAMAFDGSRILVVWDDFRNSATTDIYGTRVAEPALGTWVKLPPGGTTLPVTYSMGSPTTEPCRGNNETPHQVALTHALEISAYEVTQGEFQALMGYNPSYFQSCGADCPVEVVNWYEAVAYCNALSSHAGLNECYTCSGTGAAVTCQEANAYSGAKVYDCPGYRLPTEAEWEHAYRSGSNTAIYPSSGNNGLITNCNASDANANKIGWYRYNSAVTYTGCDDLSSSGGDACSGTHPKGQKAPNAWGLFDMAGNVWEWSHDWYQSDLGSSAVTNPWGAVSGTSRAFRGGSWYHEASNLRAASRSFITTSYRSNRLGFRCGRSLP